MFGIQWNMLHGAIPHSWTGLKMLRALWVRPGNYQLCGTAPPNAAFSLCKELDGKCVLAPSPQPCMMPPLAAQPSLFLGNPLLVSVSIVLVELH